MINLAEEEDREEEEEEEEEEEGEKDPWEALLTTMQNNDNKIPRFFFARLCFLPSPPIKNIFFSKSLCPFLKKRRINLPD